MITAEGLSANCLSYLNVSQGKTWPYIEGGRKKWQSVNGNFFSDSGDLLHEAALSGCGITMLPTFIIYQSLMNKKLEVILSEYKEPELGFFAVYQHTRHLSPKIRTLIDHLSEELKNILLS